MYLYLVTIEIRKLFSGTIFKNYAQIKLEWIPETANKRKKPNQTDRGLIGV